MIRYVRDVGVAGSNPVTQTIDFIRVFLHFSSVLRLRFKVHEAYGSKNGSSFGAGKSREISAVRGRFWTSGSLKTCARARVVVATRHRALIRSATAAPSVSEWRGDEVPE